LFEHRVPRLFDRTQPIGLRRRARADVRGRVRERTAVKAPVRTLSWIAAAANIAIYGKVPLVKTMTIIEGTRYEPAAPLFLARGVADATVDEAHQFFGGPPLIFDDKFGGVSANNYTLNYDALIEETTAEPGSECSHLPSGWIAMATLLDRPRPAFTYAHELAHATMKLDTSALSTLIRVFDGTDEEAESALVVLKQRARPARRARLVSRLEHRRGSGHALHTA